MLSSPEVVETATATVVADKELGHKLLNQYIVYEQIGKGMHGKVRRGQDSITGEDVVRVRFLHRAHPAPSAPPPSTGHQDCRPCLKAPWSSLLSTSLPLYDKYNRKRHKTRDCHHEEVSSQACRPVTRSHRRQAQEEDLSRYAAVTLPASSNSHLNNLLSVLEYMKGGEVKWRTSAREPVLTVEQARSIFRGVVLGLDYRSYLPLVCPFSLV